jgi:hypothetical protein
LALFKNSKSMKAKRGGKTSELTLPEPAKGGKVNLMTPTAGHSLALSIATEPNKENQSRLVTLPSGLKMTEAHLDSLSSAFGSNPTSARTALHQMS